MAHDPQEHEPAPRFWRSRHALGLLVIGAVAAYFLLTEHLAHVVGILPYLLLLACPLMHLFMHGGHGGHGHRHGARPPTDDTPGTPPPKPGEPS